MNDNDEIMQVQADGINSRDRTIAELRAEVEVVKQEELNQRAYVDGAEDALDAERTAHAALRAELESARYEMSMCDDIVLRRPLAEMICDLQNAREAERTAHANTKKDLNFYKECAAGLKLNLTCRIQWLEEAKDALNTATLENADYERESKRLGAESEALKARVTAAVEKALKVVSYASELDIAAITRKSIHSAVADIYFAIEPCPDAPEPTSCAQQTEAEEPRTTPAGTGKFIQEIEEAHKRAGNSTLRFGPASQSPSPEGDSIYVYFDSVEPLLPRKMDDEDAPAQREGEDG